VIVVDTSAVLALLRARDEHHPEARALFDGVQDDLLTSPLAVAEMDYMATEYARPEALHALWHDLEAGAYVVHWWEEAMVDTVGIARKHPGLRLTDASLVAVASRVGTDRIATFDQHFRRVTTLEGQPFRLLPADS
jgi:predicted nucleic acid-binding protein